MGTIKLESLTNDKAHHVNGKTLVGAEINFTIHEGTRTHRLALYNIADQQWLPKLTVNLTNCENKEVWLVLQNIANALGHIATTVAGTEGKK